MALQQLYIIPFKRCRKVSNASSYRAGCRTQYFMKVNVDFSRRGQYLTRYFTPVSGGILPYMARQVCTARQSMAHFYIVFLSCSLDCISQNSTRKCQRHDEQNQSLSVKTEPYWESNLMKVCVLLLKSYSSLPAHLEQGVIFGFGP